LKLQLYYPKRVIYFAPYGKFLIVRTDDDGSSGTVGELSGSTNEEVALGCALIFAMSFGLREFEIVYTDGTKKISYVGE
jgi:hypothetical protein